MKKKVITILALLSFILFLIHSVLGIQVFFHVNEHALLTDKIGRILITCVFLHMVLALSEVIKNTKRTHAEKKYHAFTKEETVQVCTGICIIIFAALHTVSVKQPSHIFLFISNVALFLVLFIHLGVTVPHLLISYGIITNNKLYRNLKGAWYSISTALFILYSIANSYYIGWIQ